MIAHRGKVSLAAGLSASCYLLSVSIVHAEIVGELGAKSEANVAMKVESLYLAAVAKGSFPVKRVEVKPGDTIEAILRENGAFAGSFFPVTLNALTCDLNKDTCSRPLIPSVAGEEDRAFLTALEFKPTEGDWRRLQPGSEITIPAFRVTRHMVPFVAAKQPGQSLFGLARANEACRLENRGMESCVETIEWMNNFDERVLSSKYGGPILVPGFDYSVSSECTDLCAFSTDLIRTDGVSGHYAMDPYLIVPVNPTSPGDTKPGGIDLKWLDPDIARKIQSGLEIENDRKWDALPLGETLKVEPYSSHAGSADGAANSTTTVHSRQSTLFEGVGFPSSNAVAGPDDAMMDRAVMVIDFAFDKDHCEFDQKRTTFYDCKVPASADGTCQPAKEFSYKDKPNRKRQLCGDAGRVELEQSDATSAFAMLRHGTHVAGLIGAKWDDFGINGIGKGAEIVGVEVDLDQMLGAPKYGEWLKPQIIDIARKHKVGTVVLAAGDESGIARRNWFYEFMGNYSKSLTFVVSAGNKASLSDPCASYPACHSAKLPNLISVVGLTGTASGILPEATVNEVFTIGAIGEKIIAPTPLNYFAEFSGSSQSAAIVGGAVAYASARNGSWSPNEIKNRLIACSNLNPAFIGKMQGGALNMSCLANASTDFFLTVDGDKIYGEGGKWIAKSDDPRILRLFDSQSNTEEGFLFNRVLGFQRLGDAAGTVVLHLASNDNPREARISTRTGVFAGKLGDQEIAVQTADSTRQIPVSNIAKYVRRKD